MQMEPTSKITNEKKDKALIRGYSSKNIWVIIVFPEWFSDEEIILA